MAGTRLVTPDECCLHIIDPQKSLMSQIHGADGVTKTMGLMIEVAKVLEMPIVGNTQYKKGLGPYVDELIPLTENITCIDKTEFSAYRNEETVEYVQQMKGITTVILVGVETHICVYQSAMGLLDIGLEPWIVADAVSSRSVENHDLGLARLRDEGVMIGPAEMIIYELLGKAGTSQFKALLPHIIEFNK